ncbi:hypothetical protein COUCH_01265 [Couchioplanes caeruleus]|uniref:LppU/SCO3897 family protein n=1 Tax=Couchioplanes caeruleus TaxID=56438 RepID=UPI0020C17EF8|nr:hypothetical protein [Couchioplanes caeruleus]UQU65018.1 hypothetical protein COUCH_01265 [Couchioplanes caeruleus]
MSQNGPYPGQGWSAGGSQGAEEPYTEPADPWGEAATHPAPESAWGGQPMSVPPHEPGYTPPPYQSAPLNTPPPAWHQPPVPLPPKRRNGPIVALLVMLGLLVCGGLGTTAVLLSRSGTPDANGTRGPVTPTTRVTNDVAVPEPQTSEGARFVKQGQCVRNEGNADDSPDLKIVSCASGTYEVLKRVDGRTTGEADAESKCGKVAKYTKWYFYDSELDSLDFVLCLREYGGN